MLQTMLPARVRRHALAALTATLMLAPSIAEAQFLHGRPGVAIARAALYACGGDAARLCNGVAPGGGRIAQCLMEQKDRLSPGCRRFVAEALAAQNAMLACAADAQRVCGGTLPGGGRIAACLSGKRDAVSRDCARALDEAAEIGR